MRLLHLLDKKGPHMMIINKGEKKAVSLTVKTFIIDPEEMKAPPAEIACLIQKIIESDAPTADLEELIGDEGVSEMELCTEATLTVNDRGLVVIEYPENEDDEQLRATCKIIFHPDHGGLVSMIKEGAVRTYLSFEAGKMHVCTYNTPFIPLKIYVETRAVDNRLLSEGAMRLNYVLNFEDNPPQHFLLDFCMKEV